MHRDELVLQAKEPQKRLDLNLQLRTLAETDADLSGSLVKTLLRALPAADRGNRARALRTMGVVQAKAGYYTEAEETLQQALELLEGLEDQATRADVLGYLAYCRFYLDRFEAALADSLEALQLARLAQAPLQQAFALHRIGWIYDNFGLYQEALESFLAELATFDELDVEDGRKALALNGVGISYSHLQDFGKAMTYLESALAIARQHSDLRAQALTLSHLGLVVEERREYARALEYYRQSFALYETLGDSRALARLHINIGKVQHRLNELDAALKAFNEALEHTERKPSASLAIEAHLNLSYLYYQRLEPAAALEHLYAARALTDEDAAPADAFRVHRALAEAFKLQGEFRRALAHFETYHALKERVQREAELRKSRGLLLQFDAENLQHEREMYRIKHVELARAYSQLEALSVRDPLTNLHNRRYLNQQLSRELTRAQRYRRPLSLMLADIDDFKLVNDRFSHAVGDEVLRAVAEILYQRTRAADICVRLGGEEMVVLFPETGLKDALTICEDILAAIADYDWQSVAPELQVTLSIGLAEMEDGDSPDSLLDRADKRMYEAKAAGKNRVLS